MFYDNQDTNILVKTKKRKQLYLQSEDRLSILPEHLLVHILSFLDTKASVQTSLLSRNWNHIWKKVPILMLSDSTFPSVNFFSKFVSNVLNLRDTETALHTFYFDRHGDIEPRLFKEVLNCICSYNTHLRQLGITFIGDTRHIMSCVSSCRALTSLRIFVGSRFRHASKPLFPISFNLPALVSLDLKNFTFCGSENGCAEPFLSLKWLSSLVIRNCTIKDAQVLKISSETLVNLAMHSSDFAKIQLFAPSLFSFTFTGRLVQNICGSGLSSVKTVNIDADMYLGWEKPPLVLLNWLLDLANVVSLTVSSITLQILYLLPDLSEVKLHSLCNLKSLKITLIPIYTQLQLRHVVKTAMVKKAASSKSCKEILEPPLIPDGIINFLLQNSPSAKVEITSEYPGLVEEFIKSNDVTNSPSVCEDNVSVDVASLGETPPKSAGSHTVDLNCDDVF